MDELFAVRNSFYLGHYQLCIMTGQQITSTTPDTLVERDVFVNRAHIAQGKYSTVLNEIEPDARPELRAVRLYAAYLQNKEDRVAVEQELNELLADSVAGNSATVQLMAGSVAMAQGDYSKAMGCVAEGGTLEGLAMIVQCCVLCNRVDVAQRELKRMSQIDDDHTLTQLATAWVALAGGDGSSQDAFYIYRDLKLKHGPSPMLLCGEAASLMAKHDFFEAQTALQEALRYDSNDGTALGNMTVVTQHLSKGSDVAKRYQAQLADAAPDHGMAVAYHTYDELFSRLSARYDVK